ncbi:hypothetical protein NC653_032814 [Populus alba x Populus x berolinensis]|uniref:Uncharacterized protein n=1 Tax=Populus alba x Populus x berolinensis TaxID=444605 RepID=A0AAD6LSE0_9ROSI|nr:hypothetical protein NC653_032814 [Populus alba x Populus x berolinensis]
MRYFGLSPLCSIEIFSGEFDIFTCDIFSCCSSGGLNSEIISWSTLFCLGLTTFHFIRTAF